jgi:ABC-type branched-subunit amino acid transport system ATPase component
VTPPDAARSALLVIDVQNDYCDPSGAFGRAGRDLSHVQAAVARLVPFEHDMDVALELAERVTVLHYGRVIADGPPRRSGGTRPVRRRASGLGRRR